MVALLEAARVATAIGLDIPAAPEDMLFGETWMARHDATESADFRRLEVLNGQVPEGIRGTLIFGEGDVVGELVTESAGFALVVSHGRSGLARWWLGSMAEPFVRATRCSVLVLHYPA